MGVNASWKLSAGMRAARVGHTFVAVLVVGCTVGLSGCTNDALAQQYREGSGKNYVAGDGSITEIAPGNRTGSITFTAPQLDGTNYVSAPAGEAGVTVVNFWYVSCAPCRAEAADLESVYEQTSSPTVHFVGVNIRDEAETAQAFLTTYQVTYPTVLDTNGAVQIAFAGQAAKLYTPSTAILDGDNRISAIISGHADPGILKSLIDSANSK
ncbi:hypothetical protein B7R21_16275 [Subtercola boreus]|uniref:Thioredoxin domain-containing protein n=1 Tax=Subtercola boreus TaxID=120213 RepID=A0A3E0VCU6_9MICO|nr:TlpA disulfide reductase family protein [Subtercola boreus]RFA07210.1 hypothetical protein B7R21_16275 [Subtercola boreus]